MLTVVAILYRYGHPQFAPAAAEFPSQQFKRFVMLFEFGECKDNNEVVVIDSRFLICIL